MFNFLKQKNERIEMYDYLNRRIDCVCSRFDELIKAKEQEIENLKVQVKEFKMFMDMSLRTKIEYDYNTIFQKPAVEKISLPQKQNFKKEDDRYDLIVELIEDLEDYQRRKNDNTLFARYLCNLKRNLNKGRLKACQTHHELLKMSDSQLLNLYGIGYGTLPNLKDFITQEKEHIKEILER